MDAPQEKSGSGRTSRTARVLLTIVAVTVPLIGVAAIVAPMLASIGERESGLDTLSQHTVSPWSSKDSPVATTVPLEEPTESTSAPASSAPRSPVEGLRVIGVNQDYLRIDDGAYWWRIPASAPFETFPDDREHNYSKGCTAEQHAWLKQHALPGGWPRDFIATIRNEATTGGAITLGNVRYVPDESWTTPWVFFQCAFEEPGGATGLQYIHIRTDGTPATWGDFEPDYGLEPRGPEGAPVTLTLEPGMVDELPFWREFTSDVVPQTKGWVLADIISTGQTVVLADGAIFDSYSLDASSHYDPWIAYYSEDYSSDWRLFCGGGGSNRDWGPCEPSEVADLLLEAFLFAGSARGS